MELVGKRKSKSVDVFVAILLIHNSVSIRFKNCLLKETTAKISQKTVFRILNFTLLKVLNT